MTTYQHPPADHKPTSTASRSWRWRRCPSCKRVEKASAFTVAGNYAQGWQGGTVRRRCPHCGHTGPTATFAVVREAHPAPVGVRP